MIKEEILAMEAGNELNVLVATKIMGRKFPNLDEMTLIAEAQWKVQPDCIHFLRGFDAWLDGGEFKWKYDAPDYSRNIAKAWEVVEQMDKQFKKRLQLTQMPEGFGIWQATFDAKIRDRSAATAPLAICRAALAVMDS